MMIKEHDRWSQMGEKNLGEWNIQWATKMEEWGHAPSGSGPMTLLKAIINDYWADDNSKDDWPREKVDMVMSKLYWCWVAWLNCAYYEAGEEE